MSARYNSLTDEALVALIENLLARDSALPVDLQAECEERGIDISAYV